MGRFMQHLGKKMGDSQLCIDLIFLHQLVEIGQVFVRIRVSYTKLGQMLFLIDIVFLLSNDLKWLALKEPKLPGT